MHAPDPRKIVRAIAKRSFATLATVSPEGHPHVAGALYAFVDGRLYVNTDHDSRKARNVAATGRAAVAIPIRRLPVGPPSLVHFQATAEVLPTDDPHARDLIDRGRLDPITGHGELERPDVCFLRITPSGRLLTYGLGVPLHRLVREPLEAGGVVTLPARDTSPSELAATSPPTR